jgi:hypothetical protein
MQNKKIFAECRQDANFFLKTQTVDCKTKKIFAECHDLALSKEQFF